MPLKRHDSPDASPAQRAPAGGARLRDSPVLARAARVAGVYFLFAIPWILFSDLVVQRILDMPESVAAVQVVKGLFFVFVTGSVVLWYTLTTLRHQERLEERRLREQERLYAVLETIPAYVYLQAEDYSIRYANKQFREKFGEPSRGPCYRVIQGREEPCPICPTFEIFKDSKPRIWEFHDEVRGEYYEIHDFPMVDTDGTRVVMEMGFDITERHENEHRLRQLSVAVEQSPLSIVVTDVEGRIEYVNPTFVKTTGYTPDEVIGRKPNILKSGEKTPEEYRVLWNTILSGETWRGDFSNRRKNGETYYEHATISPIRDEDGRITHFIALKQDVSDLRAAETRQMQLEQQYRRAQKLESLGTLAGGIAHDFNNILSAILGYSELLLEEEPPASSRRSDLEQIHQAGLRARDLVRQILTFSRMGEQERQPVRVDIIVREVLKLVRSTLPTTIEIHEDIARMDCLVLADPSQVHQVVMNLCTNAYQAMGEKGGRLTISLRPAAASPVCPITTGESDHAESMRYLCLSVSDSGGGIPEAIRDRIFDPFFTTKEPGRGTGLGLATVHGIVTAHGGHIEFDTAEGIGTTFKVYLPCLIEGDTAAAEPRPTLKGGHENILIVDDEQALVSTLQRRLSLLGYNVTGTTDPFEAIHLLGQHPAQYDLLLTDQQMPEMTGVELAHEAWLIRKDLPVVCMTGFSEELTAERAESLGISTLLFKPMRIEDLASAVRKALNTSRSA